MQIILLINQIRQVMTIVVMTQGDLDLNLIQKYVLIVRDLDILRKIVEK